MCSSGSYFHTLDWHEAHDGRFQLQLQNVQPPSSGIYSATYLEASPLGSAFFRLIVRGKGQKAEGMGEAVNGVCSSSGLRIHREAPELPWSSAVADRWVKVSY